MPKIKRVKMPTDGVPAMVRAAVVDFIGLDELDGQIYLAFIEDKDNKPEKNYYITTFMDEVSQYGIKWNYFDKVKVGGRVKYFFIMEG